MTINAHLDHLVITAATLDEGCAFVLNSLGVEPGPGGSHEVMSTHNRLMRLGESMYLEVIAPNPSAQAPLRPRWFGMDVPGQLNKPRLATWVARARSLAQIRQRLPVDPGPIHPMRRADWKWQITIPDDGLPALEGVLPTLIEWSDERHPTDLMPDAGCRLVCLELIHSDATSVRRQLQALNMSKVVEVGVCSSEEAPGLRAVIQTPWGERTIEGHWPE